MNITKIILPLLLLANLSFAQKLTISGNILGPDNVLKLSNRILGTDILIPVTKNKTFKAEVNIPEKGMYTLSHIAEIYLAPGRSIHIFPSDSGAYEFSGPGALENKILQGLKAEQKVLPLGGDIGIPFYVLNREASFFLDRLKAYRQAIASKASESKDTSFVRITNGIFRNMTQNLLRTYVENYGFDSLVMDYYMHPRKDGYYQSADQMTMLGYIGATLKKNYLSKQESAQIAAALDEGFSWNDEQLFYHASFYMNNMLDRLKDGAPKNQFGSALAPDAEALAILKLIDEKIQSTVIRNYMKANFGLIYLKSSQDEKRIDSVYQALSKMKLPIFMKNEIEDQRKNAKLLKMDPTSIDFAYKTINNSVVTLKSLRGKYVYIDLWATWCAPCKAEIPALQALEHEFAGKNIHFVSISLDKAADKNTWINYVKENNLSGIQLMADNDFNSDFPKIFQVNSIPRFILIAPDGKIVEANADRPSNPALKAQLSKLLN